MHPSQEPANAYRDKGAGVRLRFDGVAEPLVKGDGGLPGGVSCLTVQILGCACGLIEFPLEFATGVSCSPSEALLNLARDVASRT
jgi:hypothetical protein